MRRMRMGRPNACWILKVRNNALEFVNCWAWNVPKSLIMPFCPSPVNAAPYSVGLECGVRVRFFYWSGCSEEIFIVRYFWLTERSLDTARTRNPLRQVSTMRTNHLWVSRTDLVLDARPDNLQLGDGNSKNPVIYIYLKFAYKNCGGPLQTATT